jgi:hypothetical protein
MTHISELRRGKTVRIEDEQGEIMWAEVLLANERDEAILIGKNNKNRYFVRERHDGSVDAFLGSHNVTEYEGVWTLYF